jgi:Zn-dependent M28 family amino/carboxypeptidase
VVGVAQESADAFRAAAANGAAITVTTAQQVQSLNVIARASAGATCRVLVGGHHDTVPDVPGANDNASGSAHVLELARAAAADGLDAGLCFATFGGEEEGLFGSRALAEKWRREGSLPSYMINLDVTGGGDTVELIGEGSLQDLAESLARPLGIEVAKSTDPVNTGSDHMSFRDAGVPVLFIAGDDFSDIHTRRDTLDRVDRDLVEAIGDLALEVIRALNKRVAAG